ncbi:DUF413 domain-containing protein [candidate division KSB1 bacterium]
MANPFKINCSKEIFSDIEIEILEEYGRQLQRLMDGDRLPRTEAQRRFVEVAQGKCQPETIYEEIWWRYLQRLQWETDPANRAAMGDRRGIQDDLEAWKKMRSGLWADMQKRNR